MTLSEHLEELRRRIFYALGGLIAGMAIMAFAARWLLAQINAPYFHVMHRIDPDARLVVLQPMDAFLVYFRVVLIAGGVLASPWILYQLWMFVAAGLYDSERRIVRRAVPFSAGLFVVGAAFFLYVVSEPMLAFFMSFGGWLEVTASVTLDAHVRFMTRMMVIFGIGFQMPLVVLVLARVGLVTPEQFSRYRRHVIVILLIFAAVVTSPSPVDQVLLALPMWLLYELGLLMAKIAAKRHRQAEEEFRSGE